MKRNDEQTKIYQQMSSAKRLETGCALHDFSFNRLLLLLKRENPDLSERSLKILATKRMLGEPAGILWRGNNNTSKTQYPSYANRLCCSDALWWTKKGMNWWGQGNSDLNLCCGLYFAWVAYISLNIGKILRLIKSLVEG